MFPEESSEKDVFRRTGMKFGETENEKQLRLKRCMNVLKQAQSVPQSQFVPLQGVDADPRSIAFQRNEDDSEDDCDVTAADLVVLNKGRAVMNTSVTSNFSRFGK